MALLWKVDECPVYHDRIHMRGWRFCSAPPIARLDVLLPEQATPAALVSLGQPSPDVAAHVDPQATHCRFGEWLAVPAGAVGTDFKLRFTFADQTTPDRGTPARCSPAAQGPAPFAFR
jgi:hypothetical protein